MALQVRTNAKKKKSEKDPHDNPGIKNTESNVSINVKEISNGFIVSKSWSDKDGKYHSEEVYHKDNPIKNTSADI